MPCRTFCSSSRSSYSWLGIAEVNACAAGTAGGLRPWHMQQRWASCSCAACRKLFAVTYPAETSAKGIGWGPGRLTCPASLAALSCLQAQPFVGLALHMSWQPTGADVLFVDPLSCLDCTHTGGHQEGSAGQAVQEPRAADHENGQPPKHCAAQAVLLLHNGEG
jgi:hypothetical protein